MSISSRERSLGIYVIAKGFKASATVVDVPGNGKVEASYLTPAVAAR